MTTSTQAMNNVSKVQTAAGSSKTNSDPKELALQFEALFSSALGQLAPNAQLNNIEAQLRESLFKQDSNPEKNTLNPTATLKPRKPPCGPSETGCKTAAALNPPPLRQLTAKQTKPVQPKKSPNRPMPPAKTEARTTQQQKSLLKNQQTTTSTNLTTKRAIVPTANPATTMLKPRPLNNLQQKRCPQQTTP